MRRRAWSLVLTGLVLGWFQTPAAGAAGADSPLPRVVEFNRDIRPILSDNCFACHGPDKKQRKADLRLDRKDSAFGELDSGLHALVPGKPGESELYRRVSSRDPGERMPPTKFGKQLSARQVALIRRWIEQGAKWQKHWSLIPPRRPPLPEVAGRAWPVNAVDRFLLARLEQEGVRPSPEADRRTLLRRLHFDLTGLPPTPAEVDAFMNDRSPGAYERTVDRLLASPHYGERLALYWLDLVRYADTGGYHSDNHRDVYLYRDYVISAFNRNKPFDQFTVEQLAGDLLPHPTREQKIASGYNRLLQTTEEGGAQPKEYQAKYYADRVRNLGSVWLGATLGCCECHDHKFDPFKTREFYRLEAFFADLREKSVGRQDQTRMPTEEQADRLRKLNAQIGALQKELAAPASNPDKGKVQPAREQLAGLQRQRAELDKAIPTTLISIPGPPRVIRVLPRGNWLNDSGEVVAPGVPESLGPLPALGRRATRLDLARWLVAPDNPVTARVFVNRLWKLTFGQGLVVTPEDFGSQGAWPTHPELLDWLAVEFRASGWDVKHLVKLLVLSRAYRQSSQAGPERRRRDPSNRLLARQGRFRLDAELVRDNALAVSGLLAPRLGGPSVKPYQPAGYWSFLNFPRREYVPDRGANQYRRGLYTYWQRTFLHPSLLAFDAPTREECTAERPRSNTPLQALVLLNDPTYVEAARALAERMMTEGGKEAGPRIQLAYRRALQRPARPAEVKLLEVLYRKHLSQYQADRKAADALLHVGDRPAPGDLDAAEMAAWTSVARVVLNLHETITRE